MKQEEFNIAINFLRDIGLVVTYDDLSGEECFLPGLLIRDGTIIIDEKTLKYPGDIIHEAAHLAVVPTKERFTINGSEIALRPDREAEEMMAIAWSYAACRHLQIDPCFVFHENGYQNGGKEIVENFNAGRYFGVPMLEWLGLTSTNAHHEAYPGMKKWLRD